MSSDTDRTEKHNLIQIWAQNMQIRIFLLTSKTALNTSGTSSAQYFPSQSSEERKKPSFIYFIGYVMYLHIKYYPISLLCHALFPPPQIQWRWSSSHLPNPPQHPGIPLHWGNEPSECQTMQFSATYVTGAICPFTCIFFVWWFSLWELWGVWFVDAVLTMGLHTPSSVSVFFYSSIGVPVLHPMIICEHFHLYQ